MTKKTVEVRLNAMVQLNNQASAVSSIIADHRTRLDTDPDFKTWA